MVHSDVSLGISEERGSQGTEFAIKFRRRSMLISKVVFQGCFFCCSEFTLFALTTVAAWIPEQQDCSSDLIYPGDHAYHCWE